LWYLKHDSQHGADVPIRGGLFHRFGVAHEQFAWDIRSEPAVIDVFANIWGTEELLVSFGEFHQRQEDVRQIEPYDPTDSVNISLPYPKEELEKDNRGEFQTLYTGHHEPRQ
jgi:hypothetical protein